MDENLNMCKNVIILVVDALRKEILSRPFIDKYQNISSLKNKSIEFKNAYSCTNMTDPSITSLMTGKHPLSSGIIEHGRSLYDYKNEISLLTFLPSILKNHGYRTYAIDWLGRWHKTGFDFYSGIRDAKKSYKRKLISYIPHKIKYRIDNLYYSFFNKNRSMPYPDGSEQVEIACNILKKNKNNPFLLFIHFWDTHFPYNCKENNNVYFNNDLKNINLSYNFDKLSDITCRNFYKSYFKKFKFEGKTIKDIIISYYCSIKYVDVCLGKLINTLINLNILNDTIIFFLSDHGESLGEHDIFFNHVGLYETNLNIPLLIYNNEYEPKNIKNEVLNIDITPTVIDMLNIKLKNKFDGISIVPFIKNKKNIEKKSLLFIEDSWYSGKRIGIKYYNYKYIKDYNEYSKCKYCNIRHLPEIELYDLNKDPNELNNIVDEKNILKNDLDQIINLKILQHTSK